MTETSISMRIIMISRRKKYEKVQLENEKGDEMGSQDIEGGKEKCLYFWGRRGGHFAAPRPIGATMY